MLNRNYHNLDKLVIKFDTDYPFLPAFRGDLGDFKLVPFDRASAVPFALRKKYVVHFYIEDFLFERFWSNPDKYISMLKSFKAVVSPDFSIYYNCPDVIGEYNKFRNHFLGLYMYQNGIDVIPNFRSAGEKHFNFSLDGYPRNSVFFASNVGINKNPQQKNDFIKGLKLLSFASPRLLYIVTRGDDTYKLPYPCKVIKLDRR